MTTPNPKFKEWKALRKSIQRQINVRFDKEKKKEYRKKIETRIKKDIKDTGTNPFYQIKYDHWGTRCSILSWYEGSLPGLYLLKVLQQPESQFDVENGNTETIYQNPSTWKSNGLDPRECYGRYSGVGLDYNSGAGPFVDRAGYSVLNDVNDEKDKDLKKRNKRRPSESTLCGEDMKPSQLNHVPDDNASPKEKSSRRSLLTFLSSLARRKKRLGTDQLQYLQHIESALTACTYRESCRCLECQSSYFDCDEDEEDYESEDDSEYTMYVAQMHSKREEPEEEEEDDEVFVDQIPSDNTSTDMLLEPKKMSVSSESSEDPETMNLEVAAGTPLLLNFLLTHPITCSIQ